MYQDQDQDEQDNQQEIWNAFEDAQASKKDAIAEARYDDFMRAVNDGDKEALQIIADNAWEFAPTIEDEGTGKDAPRFQTEDDDEWVNNTTPTEQDEVIERTFPMPYPNDDAWDVSLWDLVITAPRVPTEPDAPRFPPQSAPRFQTLSELWRINHPDAFKDEDDDEWVNNTTPTEQDGVIPHYRIPMPYPNDDEWDDEEMGYVDEDFDSGWRYYRTPEDEHAFVAVAPSFRAYRAFIRGERKQWGGNLRVVRVTWRR